MFPKIATNPDTGQYLVLKDGNGALDAFGPGGTNDGGVYYGNLIDHPQFNAGEGKPAGPAVDIAWFKHGDGSWGYVIYTRENDGIIHPYHFPF